jgi:hypothetical protein
MDTAVTTMTAFGAATDPTPYILAAFGAGAVTLLGFAAWIQIERRRLQQLLAAVRIDQKQSKGPRR